MSQIRLQGTYTLLVCCRVECGVAFGVPDWWETMRREDHTTFYCPNGHTQSFQVKSDVERERELREAAERREKWANERVQAQARRAVAAEHQARAFKSVATRIKRRVGHGVCPCCQRAFQNLARHMAGQHPTFAAPK